MKLKVLRINIKNKILLGEDVSRGVLLTGMAGGIIGSIASGCGIIYTIICFLVGEEIVYLILYFTSALEKGISIATGLLLIVCCVLTGVGFYGLRLIGGSAMGIVGLILGIVGGSIGGVLIVIDGFIPGFLIGWIGAIVLGVTFVVLGASSIVMRESTAHPSVAVAAGILSIIGGSLTAIFIFLVGVFGFGLIFVAMILWAIVFYSSREM
ncbi:MAG: hypothetical protein QXR19_14925 [Candidatus Jordarchaeaceae archaeon]